MFIFLRCVSMFLLIRVFENSFTKFPVRYAEDSTNQVGHATVLVNVEQESLALYMKKCLRFCGHVEYNFWNIYRSEKYSYMEQTMQRNLMFIGPRIIAIVDE